MLRRVSLVLLIAAGCGNEPAVEPYCRSVCVAFSAWDQRCGMPRDVSEALWVEHRDYQCPSAQRLQSEGKLHYDPEAGERCLAAMAAAECGSGVPAACSDAMVGRVSAGGTCWDGRECEPGTWCAGGTCPSTCVRIGRGGEGCEGLCESGWSCDLGVCVPSAGVGKACGKPGMIDCATGAFCGPISGRCRPNRTVAEGQSCEHSQDCVAGLDCRGLDFSQTPPVAGRCRKPKVAGEACGAGECDALLFCREGHCAAAPRVGETCGAVGGDQTACAIGWCNLAGGATTGTCEVRKDVGAPCDPSANACGLYSWCDTGYCSPRCGPP